MADGNKIPDDIISAIAISNAKSIGEQPAILANLALANQIANSNLAQQNAIQNQQAMFQLQMATVAKCVEMISAIGPNPSKASAEMDVFQKMIALFGDKTAAPSGGAPE